MPLLPRAVDPLLSIARIAKEGNQDSRRAGSVDGDTIFEPRLIDGEDRPFKF